MTQSRSRCAGIRGPMAVDHPKCLQALGAESQTVDGARHFRSQPSVARGAAGRKCRPPAVGGRAPTSLVRGDADLCPLDGVELWASSVRPQHFENRGSR